MSMGDIQQHMTTGVASGGYLNVQPAAQVEIVIFHVASDKTTGAAPDTTPNGWVGLYDGTNRIRIAQQGAATLYNGLKIGSTNAVYFTYYNNDAGAAIVGYTGVQTK